MVLFFAPDGVVRSLKAYQIPQSSRTAAGSPISQVLCASPSACVLSLKPAALPAPLALLALDFIVCVLLCWPLSILHHCAVEHAMRLRRPPAGWTPAYWGFA